MRERRPHLILAAVILAALVGVYALSQSRHVTKGIDLAGGIEVVGVRGLGAQQREALLKEFAQA